MKQKRGLFGRAGFVFAAAGSAVGLGNIWKFPYITFANNGGSFVLVYLLAVLCIGLPVMLAEILVGRRTHQSPVGAIISLAQAENRHPAWGMVGWLGIASGFMILSFYSVVSGWTVYYFAKCLKWSLSGFTSQDASNLGDTFTFFLADGKWQLLLHGGFMLTTMGVVMGGIQKGIERITKLLMPTLFIMLLMMVGVASTWPSFPETLNFLFHIGPVTGHGILEAVGHAFFTLSLGMGAMMTYGSYLPNNDSIPKAGFVVVLLDTMIGMMACLVMFSIIFSVPEAERGGSFSQSMTILFTTLPRMFYSLPMGAILAPTFYILVSFAALTSTISLLEVSVAYFIDQRDWSRTKATLVVGTAIYIVGIPCALSLGAHPGLSSMEFLPGIESGAFGAFDYLASNWMLPIGGVGTAIFVGWILNSQTSREVLERGHGPIPWFNLWLFLLKYVCPIAIGGILLSLI